MKAQLARYAFDKHWWDLSVQATIAGKLWDHLEERFPLAYNDLFDRYTSGKDIPQSYAMAIARQESAWNPKVRSPVGASGLMQIMPGTATHTVKMFNIPATAVRRSFWIRIPTSTSVPAICSMFISSSAITASSLRRRITRAGRVRTWLGNSAGRIDAVAFVESIPFSETRGYVKNVLAYDAYYRYFMGQKDTLMSDAEWQRRY
jgi:soluble lytic murein transglycosylase